VSGGKDASIATSATVTSSAVPNVERRAEEAQLPAALGMQSERQHLHWRLLREPDHLGAFVVLGLNASLTAADSSRTVGLAPGVEPLGEARAARRVRTRRIAAGP
jgi:hypothetical protein